MEQILPVLDFAALQEKANEFAMKGATETLKEFYSGYNSPYRKAIEADLGNKSVNGSIELPDIIGLINERLTAEVDKIANEAVSKSFLPMVKRFLTRAKPEMKFSEILSEFIQCSDDKDYENFELSMVKDERFGWYSIKISNRETEYSITLHENYETRNFPVRTYSFLGLPHDNTKHKETMKISIDGATLELPFTRNVLEDGFTSFIARLVIAKTEITIDATDFEEEMFPEDECNCNH